PPNLHAHTQGANALLIILQHRENGIPAGAASSTASSRAAKIHILAVSADDFLSTCCTRRHIATPRTIWWSAAAKRQQCLSKPSSGTSYPPNQHQKELQVYDAPHYSRKEGNMALELF
ncbi:hypothetical protein TcCL_NonESM13590, partial [Trypanosoma cruzi]